MDQKKIIRMTLLVAKVNAPASLKPKQLDLELDSAIIEALSKISF